MSNSSSNPMAARRRLGVELRRLREAAGLSGEQAAAEFGWSQAKISRMESAVTRPTVRDVRDLLEFYQAEPATRDSLLALAAVAATRSQTWWNDYAGAVSVRTRQRTALEADATSVVHFASTIVPGLLQTTEYARGVFSCTGVERTRRNIDLAIAFRAIRKEFVMQHPPDFQVLITESALRWRPAGLTTQREQLLALIAEIRETTSLTLRVLLQYPRDGMLPLPEFMIYKFADPDVPAVAYVETPTGYADLEKPGEIAFYHDAFHALLPQALTPAESLDYVADLANTMQ